jgi:hypothetical protein
MESSGQVSIPGPDIAIAAIPWANSVSPIGAMDLLLEKSGDLCMELHWT